MDRFDRNVYFAAVRNELFGGALTQQQVDGQNVILGLWEGGQTGTPMDDLRWLAYMLATVYHECATKMWPVTEYGSQDYLEGKEYFPYVGRGFVQLTWEDNYRTMSSMLGLIDDRDLVEHPEVALDSLIAARVMFRGMAEGFFTGAKFAVAYSFIGVIAGEFVVSGAGMGHAIAFAYNSFDNRMMYGLIVLLFVLVGSVNTLLSLWERRLYARRAGR